MWASRLVVGVQQQVSADRTPAVLGSPEPLCGGVDRSSEPTDQTINFQK
jgi:hypothetical protein